ncbi:hypothetical protein MML48_3g00014803 [Holotrichia oblita]|uniref:Uncharacterized protein n=1 Tax=Holotrichia oblita TaxID=644536 RepID=A0ACB9THR9_HOLOL|nr:hypothetical protein MML48_3g00014803 [Holotrichia oblita]
MVFQEEADFLEQLMGATSPLEPESLIIVRMFIEKDFILHTLMQAICDSSIKFTHVYVGEAGSIHDACLFRRSDLHPQINNLSPNQRLIGDAAYPLSTKVMTPFKDNDHLTDTERLYNTHHAKSRVVIEQAFGLLKGRFRRLKLMENVKLEFIPQLVMAACVLHNFCCSHGEEVQ